MFSKLFTLKLSVAFPYDDGDEIAVVIDVFFCFFSTKSFCRLCADE